MFTKSFNCASNHTRKILSEYYNLKVEILFFNYITFYNKFINEFNDFDRRKYEYGLINIKILIEQVIPNLDSIVDKLRKNKLKKIFIGKNSNKYIFLKLEILISLEMKKYLIIINKCNI